MFLNFVYGNKNYYHGAKVVIFAISSLQKTDIFSANYIKYTCLIAVYLNFTPYVIRFLMNL